tara:strand:- start:411 stop:614 length:204 start_codon:yes stop_codon:yes gene_type:complete
MKKGIIKEFNVTKVFGFITSQENEDYFVHVSGLREHWKSKGLNVGQRVSFDVDFGMKGDKAINVRLD